MQDSHCQIKDNYSIIIIICSIPFIIWNVCGILPTFDDFTTLQSPQFTPFISTLLLPNDDFWRPWDYLFGCILGRNTSLFPWFNHFVIVTGHTLNSFLVFLICKKIGWNSTSSNIATLFFFFSPASLGATLACDGLNQTFAQCWGLVATYCFLTMKDKQRVIVWGICTMMAALSKENGLAWAIIPPLIAYGFDKIDKKQTIHFIFIGLSFAIIYFFLRFSLRVSSEINEEYIASSLLSHLKDFIQIIVYNWIPIDYMSIVYSPERNWMLAAVTFVCSTPFLLLLAISSRNYWTNKSLLILIACFFIVCSPHLITLVSIMHNYAPLSITALIVGYIINKLHISKWHITCFSLFIFAALITDIHHTIGALNSGYLGKRLAMEAIKQTNKPITHAYCISIDDERTPKYSSFSVTPIDAFAWGLSVRHYTNYTWPIDIKDTLLTKEESIHLNHIIDSVLQTNMQCVWIVNGKHILVKKK